MAYILRIRSMVKECCSAYIDRVVGSATNGEVDSGAVDGTDDGVKVNASSLGSSNANPSSNGEASTGSRDNTGANSTTKNNARTNSTVQGE